MSSLSTLPKGDSAWLLRKAIERIIQQVSVLETNIGASTSGNSANTQIIFNDAGVLRGDAGLVYNKTTDALTVTGLVTAGSATITGDLTVDTSTLVVDATNNFVGIGTASPVQGLTISGDASVRVGDLIYWNAYWNAGFKARAAGYAAYIGEAATGDFTIANTNISAAGPTSALTFLDRYRITNGGVFTWENAGNVAGTAMTLNSTVLAMGVTPAPWATIKAIQVGAGASLFGYTATEAALCGNTYYNAGLKYVGNGEASQYQQQIGEHRWYSAANNTAGAGAVLAFGAAKMTLDGSGNLYVGKTTSSSASTGCELQTGTGGSAASVFTADAATASIMNRLTSDGTIIDFRRSSSGVGSIAVTTTATAYNTSSDYRLKESAKPLVGGLARVNALKPSIYKWKVNGSTGEGFIAHELADVVPFAVTGDKDAVDADGKPAYQGVDLSKLVPILVAAIQELTAEVNALKNA